jgi:hypothetical protein
MSAAEAEQLSERLLSMRGSGSAARLRELLWLRAVFVEQRRRTPAAEKLRFDRRADRILARLWRPEMPALPSGARNTLTRSEKR